MNTINPKLSLPPVWFDFKQLVFVKTNKPLLYSTHTVNLQLHQHWYRWRHLSGCQYISTENKLPTIVEILHTFERCYERSSFQLLHIFLIGMCLHHILVQVSQACPRIENQISYWLMMYRIDATAPSINSSLSTKRNSQWHKGIKGWILVKCKAILHTWFFINL